MLQCKRRLAPRPAWLDVVLERWRRLVRRVLLELQRRLVAGFAGAFLAFWRDRRRLL